MTDDLIVKRVQDVTSFRQFLERQERLYSDLISEIDSRINSANERIDECIYFWTQELRNRQENYNACINSDERRDCSSFYYLLIEAEENLDIAKQCRLTLEQSFRDFKSTKKSMQDQLQSNLPQAIAYLSEIASGVENLLGYKTSNSGNSRAGDEGNSTSKDIKVGSFSIYDWQGYPSDISKPTGPFRLLENTEYEEARLTANEANRSLHYSNMLLKGYQIHEVQPVKFGGSPTNLSNKTILTQKDHSRVTSWWRHFQREMEK